MEQEQEYFDKIARLQKLNIQLQEKLVEQPQELTPNCIMFYDGTKFILSDELINMSGLLKRTKQQGTILQDDTELFKKYVMYLLKNEKIPSIDCDELHEINTIFNLCKKYEIEMTTKQLINISDSINLQKSILDIKHLWELVNRVFRFHKQERYENFREFWNNHINLLSQVENNANYKRLTSDFIINAVLTLSYLELSDLNFKYNNIIFKYSKWLHQAIKSKSFNDIKNDNLKLFDIVSGVVAQITENPLALITKAVELIPGSAKSAAVNMVIDQVKKLMDTTQILK
jgi:hypothetical protein